MARRSAFEEAKRRGASRQPPPLPDAAREVRLKPPPLPARARKTAKPPVLEPGDLDPLKNLLLFAQTVVEGWFAGRHRSTDFGTNAEFVEHRHYVVGDPISAIDWQVYARSRNLAVRKYREEKDLTGYLVVDVSGSMAYQAEGRESKQLRAARIAASLAYLMQRQGDKSSLALFHESLAGYVAPGSTRRHLHEVVTRLEEAVLDSKGKTHAHGALDLCVPLFRKRGSLIVISDFFTDLDRFFDAVARFQHRRFDILLLHVVDPDEVVLPDVALARFIDMETGEALQVAPDEIRKAYRKEMDAMTERLCGEARRRGIDYHILKTEAPYLEAIEAWLGLRGKVKGGRRGR
ncbi:MAG: DUF58 domain-containing protein [Verrucomicrobiales bacterium]